ncbi:Retrotransposable element Tf2 155 kDa protein type 2, partial [Termitomyces sp. J132]
PLVMFFALTNSPATFQTMINDIFQQAAFDALKQAVTSEFILLFPDDDALFCVEANSLDFATGAVLSQQSKKDGKWHPVTFYSKSLDAVEQDYKIHDKEMLPIITSKEGTGGMCKRMLLPRLHKPYELDEQAELNKWVLQDRLLTLQGHLYMPNIPELHQCIVEQHHNSEVVRHLGHSTIIAIRIKSCDALDPDLGNGFKSNCLRHDAVKLASSKSSQGNAATEVGTIECIRHDMKRPCSVGDLQVREQMDLHENTENNMVTATFELPGLKKEDVSIDIHNSRLTISGESKISTEHNERETEAHVECTTVRFTSS